MQEKQNYQNHTRWYPLVHFFITPVLIINFLWQSVMLYREPSWDRAESVLLAAALMALVLAARLQALKAQDRIIHLEEKLRYKELKDKDLTKAFEKLTPGQIIALRFASDDELPGLVRQAVNGELKTSKEIKLAVKNWRGDYRRV